MPVDYLGRPYFDSWAQTDFSTYIEAGWMTLEEVANAKARAVDAAHGEPPTAMTLQQVLQEDHDHAFRFDGDIDTAPAFSVGQRVVTAKHGHAGHTRLPQYARVFDAAELWPEASGSKDKVCLDLWESYLRGA
jgi:nitrile hydratase